LIDVFSVQRPLGRSGPLSTENIVSIDKGIDILPLVKSLCLLDPGIVVAGSPILQPHKPASDFKVVYQ
jgi:hypothetical protein